MGDACSTTNGSGYTGVDDNTNQGRSNMHSRQDTLFGIDSEAKLDFYGVGVGIESLAASVWIPVNQGNKSQEQTMKEIFAISNKFKSPFYTLSTVAHVCIADGIMHEKEAAFIRNHARTRDVPEKEIEEIMKGKNYLNEMVKAREDVYDYTQGKSSTNNENSTEKEEAVHGFKKYFILLALLAASQDGLAKEEYKQCAKLALEIGLTKQDVKDCVDMLKMEKKIATQLKYALNP